MTLGEFSIEVVPVLQLAISIIGVIGVYLLWYQIKTTHLWNKANSQHVLLSNLPSQEDEAFVWKLVEASEKDHKGAITEMASREIYENLDNWVKLKSFLNKFEQLCAAINAKTVDESYAYAVHSARITDVYFKFHHYIDYIRVIADDDEIYIEIQKVASRWHERYKNTKKSREAQLKELGEKLNNSSGTKPIVP